MTRTPFRSQWREYYTEAGYISAKPTSPKRDWILTTAEGTRELWTENPGHASYGVTLPGGIELEFVRSY